MSAAIGISVAVQQYLLAVGVTILSLLVLLGLRAVEVWVGKRVRHE
nr:hypothetical protein [Deinococcus peraridilitoris]